MQLIACSCETLRPSALPAAVRPPGSTSVTTISLPSLAALPGVLHIHAVVACPSPPGGRFVGVGDRSHRPLRTTRVTANANPGQTPRPAEPSATSAAKPTGPQSPTRASDTAALYSSSDAISFPLPASTWTLDLACGLPYRAFARFATARLRLRDLFQHAFNAFASFWPARQRFAWRIDRGPDPGREVADAFEGHARRRREDRRRRRHSLTTRARALRRRSPTKPPSIRAS